MTRLPLLPKSNSIGRRLTPVWLALLVTACATGPRSTPASAPAKAPQPASVPALPAQARQPVAPALCLPTCSDGWRRLAESLLPLPMPEGPPEPPASGPTTR